MEETEIMPDDDLQASLLAAARSAQAMQQRGVRVVPRPTKLPPLNIDALMRLPAAQAAQVIRRRRDLEQDNIADEQNQVALQKLAIEEHGARKEWDRAGAHFAQEWGATAQKNREAMEAKDEAEKALEHLKQVGFAQRDRGSLGLMPTKERPNPRGGVHAVTPWTANPVKLDKDEGRTFANQKLSSSLNEGIQHWTKEYNDALESLRASTAKTTDLLRQIRIGGFQPDAQGRALVDFRTGKAYPIGSGGGKNVKKYVFDPVKGLVPK